MKNFLLWLLLFTSSCLFAQRQNLKFEHFSTEKGLSQSTVSCVFQDSRGLIWFGTWNGLNKFDGYTFTVFQNDPGNPKSITNNLIHEIVEDKFGDLWIATYGGGLVKFDRETEQFKSYRHDKDNPNSLANDLLFSLVYDSEGIIWLATQDNGIDRFDPVTEVFTNFPNREDDKRSISANFVKKIIEDSQHNIWAATNGGLNLFDRKTQTFTRYRHQENNNKSLANDNVWALFEDSKGRLWVGTRGGGLDLFDRKTGEFTHFKHDPKKPNTIANKVVLSLEEDRDGNIWVGTENGGISIYDPEEGTFLNAVNDDIDKTTLSNNSIYSIYKDARDNMWVGTYSGGVNFLNWDANKFNHYRHTSAENSLSHNNVTTIFEDSRDNLWIGTDGGGMNLFDRKTGKFKPFKHKEGDPNSICGNYILNIVEDESGNIWIGTWGAGITIYNPEKDTYKHHKHNPSDSTTVGSNNVWAMHKDSENNMWVGLYYGTGVDKYNPKTGTFKHYRYEKNDLYGLSSRNVNIILEDSKGSIWISTDGEGVNKFDKKTEKFTHYKNDGGPNSLSNNTIYSMYEDGFDNLWFGTNCGLSCLNLKNNSFKVYYTKDGLPSNVVYGVLEDRHHNLWISTNNGLSKFNRKENTFQNYTVADGIQSKEFSRANAHCRSRSGLLYFGGNNGFNEFDPDKIKERPFDPNLLITDFQIFNKKVPILNGGSDNSVLTKHISETSAITLSYKESVFSLEFASLNYTDANKKKYAYKLEGFEDDWNYVGTKRTVSYTNLNPGTYLFKVKGLDNEGNWSKKIKTLSITVLPPFWSTWWFRALIILGILSCIVSIFVIRIGIIKRQKRELEIQVLDRTSEIMAQNEEIITQREKLEELLTDVQDSIRAAEELQKFILPSLSTIQQYLPQSFILNKPKDIVSGDFYWFGVKDDKIIIATVDCVGHGVAGAFMSVNGHHLLNQTIFFPGKLDASEILDRLHRGLIEILHLKGKEESINVGMDIGLCIIDKKSNLVQFAGANNPLYIVRDNNLIEIKGNKFPIGSLINTQHTFTNHEHSLLKDDTFYLFSDGYADQIGGITGDEKFMYPRFRELLLKICNNKMEKQAEILDKSITEWKGYGNQLDDILIIGFKC